MSGFQLHTQGKCEFIDITRRVSDQVATAGAVDGACVVFVPHTTAGVTVNEVFDPAVASDLLVHLERLVPRDLTFAHAEGNADAHIKASLIGSSVTIPVVEGRLALGHWQGVMLGEFDGPRMRRVYVQVISEAAG